MSDNIPMEDWMLEVDWTKSWEEWEQEFLNGAGVFDAAALDRPNSVSHFGITAHGPSMTGHVTYDGYEKSRLSADTEFANVYQSATILSGPSSGVDTSLSTQGTTVQKRPASAFETGGPRKVSREDAALRCCFDGCDHRGTFPRQYELDRHIATKHEIGKRFQCPVAGCFQGPSQTSFTRPDKLTAHLRSCHSKDTMICCPDSDCRYESILELMAIHWKHFHKNFSWDKAGTAISHAASPAYTRCPLWCCRKYVRLESLISHVLAHQQDDIRAIVPDLVLNQYYPIKAACMHDWAECDCVVTGICITCPVCSLPCETQATFQQHFDAAHLLGPDQESHLALWIKHARAATSTTSGKREHIRAHKETLSLLRAWSSVPRVMKLACPVCDWTYWNHYRPVDHHLSLLGDATWLKPYRFQILRLYPDFADHPTIWDDLV